jgi:hypothetical protein
MSVQYDPTRARFVVRWREAGKQRVRRFASEPDAIAFDVEVNPRGRSAERATNPGGRIAAEERAANLSPRRSAGQARDGVYANGNERWRTLALRLSTVGRHPLSGSRVAFSSGAVAVTQSG